VYGLTNKTGIAQSADITAILEDASGSSRIIDTAISYEKAETVLGEQKVDSMSFRLVTKTRPLEPSINSHSSVVENFGKEFQNSLKNLNAKKVYGLMIHNPKDLLGPHGEILWSEMLKLKKRNLVCKIGCSFYTPDQFFCLNKRFDLELIQFPYNIYDQRYIDSGIAEVAMSKNIEVHLRSIFLQGLLLLPPEKLSNHFKGIRQLHQSLTELSKETNLSSLSLALRFALDTQFNEKLIIGTETLSQWREIKALADLKFDKDDYLTSRLKTFGINDSKIINPSNWRGI